MDKLIIRKYIGYAGQVGIVLVSLYLLFTVGMDFYLYDVEYSDGSDDARWTIPKESWDYAEFKMEKLVRLFILTNKATQNSRDR